MRAFFDLFTSARNAQPANPARMHVQKDAWPAAIYAIGDIHGCLDQLLRLEAEIVRDADTFPGEKWIVMLGDYVDRGPDSAGVLDHLAAPHPPGFQRICLVGNHEIMMQAFLETPRLTAEWLQFGGNNTLQSYGLDWHETTRRQPSASRLRQIVDAYIPQNHMAFLRSLPLSLSVGNLVFVHAGMRADTPLTEQDETDLLWMRYSKNEAGPQGWIVVHGHTPQEKPLLLPTRICLDTGAFATGILSGARLIPGQPPTIFQTAG